MALHVPKAPGFQQMMKDGSRFYAGLDEAILRNLDACKQLANTTKSTYGPRGLNKMVINHLEKLFVTNDAATILSELDVAHPAAKMVVHASEMQEQEVGDGTNFVIVFAGALLEQAEELLRMGLKPAEVVEGFELALKKCLEILPGLTCFEVKDVRDLVEVSKGLKTSLMSKQYGTEDFLTSLVARACISILPEKKTTFNVDSIRVCKILGSGLLKSEVVQGMVFKRHVEGDVAEKTNARIALYTCPIDVMQTETKGTVLIHSAKELMAYSEGEENQLEKQIKAIKEAGCNVIVAGGKFGDLALHYCNKYDIMAVRLNSKFDLRRLCKTVNGTALPRVTPPTPDEIGHCDKVYVDELGDVAVVVFRQEESESRIATIVLRCSTDNMLDSVERAINDGINTFKAMSRDGRFLPGAGAVEIELSKQLSSYGETCPGLEQYSVMRFAQALEALPRALAANAGVRTSNVIEKLHAAHQEGRKYEGVNIDMDAVGASNSAALLPTSDSGAGGDTVMNAVDLGVLDLFVTKFWGVKYATNAACTVLKVDQIIMAKPAGGPKAKAANKDNDDD